MYREIMNAMNVKLHFCITTDMAKSIGTVALNSNNSPFVIHTLMSLVKQNKKAKELNFLIPQSPCKMAWAVSLIHCSIVLLLFFK